MKKSSLLIIFLTVFIDLVGFGIVLPLLPVYADEFYASGFMIGLIVASYSMMQFVFAPAWGRLSDRIGRRPVILVSLAGIAVSYAGFAVASYYPGGIGLLLLLGSRVFAGIFGANLSVASAYIADISPPEQRSKRMGLIGMAFGLGFILGPAIGAVSADIFGMPGPGWVAAALCGINFVWACFVLGESRKPDSEPAPARPKLQQWKHTLSQPTVGFLIGLIFFATFCFTCFETTMPLLLKKNFGYSLSEVGYFFAYCGFLAALIQGGLMGRLVKMFGEHRLIYISLIVLAVSLVILPLQMTLPGLLIALGLYALGSGLNRPPTFGLISINSPDNEQGATMGVAQGAGSLARVLGPLLAATLYELEASLPYLVSGAIALLSGLVAWWYLCHKKDLKTHQAVASKGGATEPVKS